MVNLFSTQRIGEIIKFGINKLGILTAVLTFVLATISSSAVSAAGTTDSPIEPEWFVWTPSSNIAYTQDANASGGSYAKISANASGIIYGNTPQMVGFYVIAKGTQCSGAPSMQIKVNGTVVATQSVTATTWTQYRYAINVPAGTQAISIAFTNQYTSSSCSRALFIDTAGYATSGSIVPASGAKAVSLGDSYSSGFGTELTPTTYNFSVYDPSTTTSSNKCYRSSISAAHLLANARGYNFTDTSCAGASTDTILTYPQFNESPQLSKIAYDTSLVTMTIGGNDINLLTFVDCASNSECTNSSSTMTSINSKLTTLQSKVTNVLTAVKQKAPTTQIIIAGYPYFLPVPGKSVGACSVYSPSEQTVFKQLIDNTNTAIKAAALAAGGNVTYVDPQATGSPFLALDSNGQQTDACSASTQRLFVGIYDNSAISSWHPNAYGASAYYTIYNNALNQ